MLNQTTSGFRLIESKYILISQVFPFPLYSHSFLEFHLSNITHLIRCWPWWPTLPFWKLMASFLRTPRWEKSSFEVRGGQGGGIIFCAQKYNRPPISYDYQERARTILAGCRGGSVGSYTDSPGDENLGMDLLVDQNLGAWFPRGSNLGAWCLDGPTFAQGWRSFGDMWPTTSPRGTETQLTGGTSCSAQVFYQFSIRSNIIVNSCI